MKAVLGFLFLLVGFTVGWLVLSGKLPNTSSSSTSSNVIPAATDAQINNRYRNQTQSVLGLPTTVSAGSLAATQGVFK